MDLNSSIEENFRLNPKQKTGFKKAGLKKIKDLLFYFPSRYESFSERKNICDLASGDKTTVFGEVLEIDSSKTFRKKMTLSEATIGDNTGTINAIWFRQPYIAKMLKIGDKIALTGKISSGKTGLILNNPDFEKINNYEAVGQGASILSIYPETSGLTSRWLRFAVQKILNSLENNIIDPIPEEIIKKYHLPSLKSSLIFIHAPEKLKDAEVARKRFSFEEIFFIQLSRLKQRSKRDKEHSLATKTTEKNLEIFLNSFPFKLTSAQKKAINVIADDMRGGHPMSRLLEGDVGSGKTAVAIAAVYIAISSEYQVAYMAPTEILAKQHFESFIKYFSELRLAPKIGLITSSECLKFPSKIDQAKPTNVSRNQLLKWVENGEIPILIGTHSLIQESVRFKNITLVIIDEQHRFGTNQRSSLASNKSKTTPHLLSMTATPIPRTLALTMYGDLDLSLLDEMPAGRKEIITEIVSPSDRQKIYEKIRNELKNGRQMYVICPRIDEPDPEKETAMLAKSVKEESVRLEKEIFPEFNVGILHGKMLPSEKEEALANFNKNETQILVATSVVEVGINVPNATIIIIEGAERFGLAQLHQMRGRVIRSNHQPYCYIFTESRSQKTNDRLRAIINAKNGFELAEHDLRLRGAGELSGGKQWGVSDLGMEALRNIKMVEAARAEAQKIISNDFELKKYPALKEKISSNKKIHFE